MYSRQEFEAWWMDGAYGSRKYDRFSEIGLSEDDAFEIWQAAREESEDLKTARRNLYDAIHSLTDSLDYEWTGDFRPEIEKLNGAHMRFSVKHRRLTK